MSRPNVFAHRGASADRFENTMPAFEKALAQGANGIELDVQVTEDGVPIVIHDPDLARLAGIRQPISSMTSQEIANVRVGKKISRLFHGHRIPTLLEAVTFSEQHGLILNIELKETVSEHPETIKQIVDIATLLDNFHFSSFDYNLLEKIKELDATIETAYLLRKKGVDWDHLEQYVHADSFHVSKKFLKEPYLSKLIQSGKKIRVYGMTGQEDMANNPPPYIAGWITDYPDRF
ncbi:glycerophosphodiester phosphodiesterase [Sporosarcina sp. NPDC096371]|uniref:glycerophosphodiester phosphodiesterase n=1 Tax=Sporosarcina sp. NPDC096371 TaxID=3364530 RepID=UPI00380CABF6